MKIQYIIFFLLCIVKSFAQVGVGTLEPTADLDINYKVKLPDLESTKDLHEFDKYIIADEDGNLGYRYHYQNELIFNNVYLKRLETVKSIGMGGSVNLGMPIEVTIPPHSTRLFEIVYSIPIIMAIDDPNQIYGAASISLTKDINNVQTVIKEASREIAFAGTYNSQAAAKGRAISNFYFDKVENTTDQEIKIIYNLTANASDETRNIKVGMWQSFSGNNGRYNYNWGRGVFMISVFDI